LYCYELGLYTSQWSVDYGVRDSICETGQDRTKVTIDDQQEVTYVLLVVAKINDLG